MKAIETITICICTLRRLEGLERLLRGLAQQVTQGEFTIDVVVIENDREERARSLVEGLREELGFSIRYALETEPGIAVARNRALQLAQGDYVAIIDDDEFPSPEWLLRMKRGIATFGVDGTLGPIFPFFDAPPPVWLAKSRFCELPVYPTGTLLRWDQTRTGNVLLRRTFLVAHGLTFDARFRTGGSDQDFFKRAMAVGGRFVAIEEGAVYETVPRERWTTSYWVRRALVNGFNANKYFAGSGLGIRVRRGTKSLMAVVVYALATPFAACAGRHRLMQLVEKGAYHLSSLCGLIGVEPWKKRDF